jgi:hypothetical protein
MTAPILIGIATGFVSALLFAQASTGTALGLFVLFFLSPLPVAIAGLGWGWISAAVAAVIGAVTIGVVGTERAALFHALALGVPTAIFSYLLLLSREIGPPERPGDPPALEWYPVGRVIMFVALWGGALSVAAILTTATDIPTLKAEVRETIDRMVGAGVPVPTGAPASSLGPAELSALTDLMTASMPGIIASAWMAIATLNIWLAGHITRASGRLVRPWPDLPAIMLPRIFPLLFAGAILATFLPGYTGLLASGVASALFFPYVLIGLAILHYVTRGTAFRGPLLAAVYASLVLFNPISGLIIALIGIAEPISPLKRRWPQPPSSPSQT